MMNRPLRMKEVTAPLNWRRGLSRIWLVISAAWIMGWIIYFLIEFISGKSSPRDLLAIPVVLFGPPVALLLFGMATRWAFQGFEDE
jgi:hypothetical protein